MQRTPARLSLAFISHLLNDAANTPVFFLLAANNRGILRRPWLERVDAIELSPLDNTALAALAKQALDGVHSVDELVISTLLTRSTGRPGALLAAIESLYSTGGIKRVDDRWEFDTAMLTTLVDMDKIKTESGGRFDELDETELLVARTGAIFGVRFWLGGVAALIRKSSDQVRAIEDFGRDGVPDQVIEVCTKLVDRGVLVQERATILPNEIGYRFVEEADVDKLLELHSSDELQSLSGRAAAWLELVGPQRLRELSSIIAPLWLAAGDQTHAAHVFLRAGQCALEELRHDDARPLLQKAHELAPQSAASVHILSLSSLGELAELDGQADEAERLYRDMLGLTWSYRARGHGATALNRLGRLFRTKGQINQALEHLVPALKLFESVEDQRGMASCCDEIGRCYWLAGNMKPALSFLQQSAQYRENLGDKPGLASTLTNMGVLAMSAGQNDTAAKHLDRAIEVRRKNKEVQGLVESLNAKGILLLNTGEVEAAVASMQEAYDLSKRVGNRRMQATLQNNLGEVLLSHGRLEDAESLLYKAVEGAGRLGDHNLLSDAARNLALAARQRDDPQRAGKWARRSVAAAQLSDVTRVRAAAMGTLGEILADTDDIEATENAFRRAAQLWSEANDRGALVGILQTHAAFLMRVGHNDAAEALVQRVNKLEKTSKTKKSAAKNNDSSEQ